MRRVALGRILLALLVGLGWAIMPRLVMGQQPTPPGYTIIQQSATPLVQRRTLNFTGSGVSCADNSGQGRTDCTITSGSGTPVGSSGQVQYNNAGAFGGTAGVTVSSTELTSVRYRPTTKSATATLTTTDGPLVACDTTAGNVILTLPAASTSQGSWAIIKTISDAFTCSIRRGGSDLINGASTDIVLDAQWERADLIATSTTSWSALLGILTVGTAQIADDAVTYAKMQNVSAVSKLLGRGSAAGAGDPEEITLGTNLSMSGTTLNATGGGGGGTGTIQLWPGFISMPDGTTNNVFASSQVVKSSGTVTNGPSLTFQDLVFDPSIDQAFFSCFAMPADYASGGTLYLNWRRTAGTTAQNAVWKGAVAALTPGATENITTKALSTVAVSAATAAGTTTNAIVQSTITLNMDSAVARDSVCIMVGRDADAAGDTLADPAGLVNAWLEYTK